MKSLFEMESFGVVKHINGRILRVNKKGAEIMGYDIGEALTMNLFDLFTEEGRSVIAQAIVSGEQRILTVDGLHKDGSRVKIDVYPDAVSADKEGVRIGLFKKADS